MYVDRFYSRMGWVPEGIANFVYVLLYDVWPRHILSSIPFYFFKKYQSRRFLRRSVDFLYTTLPTLLEGA